MHEYALAEGIIAAALEVAAEGGVKQVTRVAVVVGELQ
jgi:Zn finger protein HypA/HybF involved in hydrogenase expression